MFGTCLRVRKESLKAGEERRRILKVVSQFAVHYSSVKFRVVSDGRVELTTEHCASSNRDNKLVVFSQLFQHRPDDIFQADTKLNSTACLTGIFTKPKTASAKSKSLMLLVNNRIVELTDIFTAVDDAYISCYKSIHLEDITYTVYLSLSIDPKLIDCNVHPTKKVVQIVNSADLCEKITKWVLEVLKAECRIMPFYEQEKMPIRVLIDQSKKGKDAPRESNQLPARTRTDSKQLPLRYYIPQQSVQ
jgi:DNA mismatch repair ATPase MutL